MKASPTREKFVVADESDLGWPPFGEQTGVPERRNGVPGGASGPASRGRKELFVQVGAAHSC
jgi:hypothetical protein